MPLKLKSRTQMPPDGIQYRQPESGWTYVGWDFEDGAQQILAHRQANPQLRLSTNIDQIRNELDAQNAARVAAIPDAAPYYLVEGDSPPPKLNPTVSHRVKQLAVGREILVEWLGDGGVPVDSEKAESRASVCAVCPLNGKSPLTDIFTVPVAALIQKSIERKNEMKLATSKDDVLGTCTACTCPLKLKIWVPIEYISAKIPKVDLDALDAKCWILGEIM